MEYYAHTNEEKPWQPLKDHLLNVAAKASTFASFFDASKWGYVIGLLHDIGKYSIQFQNRLRGDKLHIDHSTAGLKLALDLFSFDDNNLIGIIVAYCVAFHHTGLLNYGSRVDTGEDGTFVGRTKKEICDYSAFKKEISEDEILSNIPSLDNLKRSDHLGFTIGFFIKMLYSCLVDADFLDTEAYMRGTDRLIKSDFNKMNQQLNAYLKRFDNAKKTKLNLYRSEIQKDCKLFSPTAKGIFNLTVPTGGGKTLASLLFALNHLQHHNLRRIIYVIPYTSIIEQTAAELKDIFGDEYVLEHHHNYDFRDIHNKNKNEENAETKLKLATENWDVPIVVTTNVQFFESLFANKSSRTRKIHNISNSVIIFDEAQMLPINYLKPCLYAMSELVLNYKCSIVLCTATQPNIDDFMPNEHRPINIIKNYEELYNSFKRVKINNLNKIYKRDLIDRINKEDQVLCIVNTKKLAYSLFNKIDKTEYTFHLSTNMTPFHRSQVISEIKKLLKLNKPCKVVSTQLVEAGVDIDFDVVYREMAGIDSIIQSAGRCNREGHQEQLGSVYVFGLKDNSSKIPPEIVQASKIAEEIFLKYEDPICIDAINDYYKRLYLHRHQDLDKYKILKDFEGKSNLEYEFETISNKVKLIKDSSNPVIVNQNEDINKLIAEILDDPYPHKYSRSVQKYSVGVYPGDLDYLIRKGLVVILNDTYYLLNEDSLYDEQCGLVIKDKNQCMII